MKAEALFQAERFDDCVAVGGSSSDPRVIKIVSRCKQKR